MTAQTDAQRQRRRRRGKRTAGLAKVEAYVPVGTQRYVKALERILCEHRQSDELVRILIDTVPTVR